MQALKQSFRQYDWKLFRIIFLHSKACLTLTVIALYAIQKFYFVEALADATSQRSALEGLALLYGASVLTDFILFALTDICAGFWQTHSLSRYFERVEQIYLGRCDLVGSKKAQDTFTAATVSPAPELLLGIIDYIVQLARVALASIGLAVGLSATVSGRAGASLLLSAFLMAVLAFNSASLVRKVTSLRNSARARLSSKYGDGFNVVAIGNTDSGRAWAQQALIAKRRYFNRTIGQIRVTSTVHVFGAIVTYGTVLSVTALFTTDSMLTIALLPKLLEGCKGVMDCGNLVSSVGSAAAGFRQLHDFLDEPARIAIDRRIDWAKISFCDNHGPIAGIDDLPPSGRITLRGPNGSGKSSILTMLKIAGGRGTIFVPAGISLLHDIGTSRSSLGEAQRASIRSAIDAGASTILLDEWDANLDNQAIADISQELDQIVRTGVRIVETRHRT